MITDTTLVLSMIGVSENDPLIGIGLPENLSRNKHVFKNIFSSVITFITGIIIVGAAFCFLLFGLLELDHNNPLYGLVGGAIGSVYYSWWRAKQKSMKVLIEE